MTDEELIQKIDNAIASLHELRDRATPVPPPADVWVTRPPSFYDELRALVNRHCMENGSNTPDYVLAHFLTASLDAFDVATNRRSVHYSGGAQA